MMMMMMIYSNVWSQIRRQYSYPEWQRRGEKTTTYLHRTCVWYLMQKQSGIKLNTKEGYNYYKVGSRPVMSQGVYCWERDGLWADSGLQRQYTLGASLRQGPVLSSLNLSLTQLTRLLWMYKKLLITVVNEKP